MDLVDILKRIWPDDKRFQGEWVLVLFANKKILRYRTTFDLEKDTMMGWPKWWAGKEAQIIITERDGIIIKDNLTGKPGGIIPMEKVQELKGRSVDDYEAVLSGQSSSLRSVQAGSGQMRRPRKRVRRRNRSN